MKRNLHFLQADYTYDTNSFSAKEDTNVKEASISNSKENEETVFITYSNNFKDAFSRNRLKRSNDKLNKSLDSLLKTLSESLKNSSTVHNVVLNESNFVSNIHDDEDRCQTWLDKREKIEAIFPGEHSSRFFHSSRALIF